jgi:hypothetical protein
MIRRFGHKNWFSDNFLHGYHITATAAIFGAAVAFLIGRALSPKPQSAGPAGLVFEDASDKSHILMIHSISGLNPPIME